jgi:hypothetical protein
MNSENSIHKRNRPYAVAGFFVIPLLAFAAVSMYHSSESIVTRDSPSYLYFGADRPVGYPLFLAFVHMVFKTYAVALPVQLGILSASLGFLAWCFFLYTGEFWQSIVFEALLFLNPGLLLLANSVMSDSLSAAFIALFVAALFLVVARSELWAIGVFIAVTCVSITFRPVNLALIPAAIAAILIFGRNKKIPRTALICLLLLGLFIAQELTPFVHWVRGEPTTHTNPLARGLVQKTLFRQWPQNNEAERCEGDLIAKDTIQVDAYLAETPEDIRPYLLDSVSGYLRFDVSMPELIEKHHFNSVPDLDPILMCYALSRMKSDPIYFAQAAVDQFWELLTYSTYVSSSKHDRIEGYLRAHPPLFPPSERSYENLRKLSQLSGSRLLMKAMHLDEYERAIADLHLDPKVFASERNKPIKAPHARPQILANGLRLFQIVAALLMLAGMPALFGRKAEKGVLGPWPVLGVLGLAFFGEMTITAIVEIALPRYVYPLWPLLCGALAIGLSHFWRCLRGQS